MNCRDVERRTACRAKFLISKVSKISWWSRTDNIWKNNFCALRPALHDCATIHLRLVINKQEFDQGFRYYTQYTILEGFCGRFQEIFRSWIMKVFFYSVRNFQNLVAESIKTSSLNIHWIWNEIFYAVALGQNLQVTNHAWSQKLITIL